MARIQRYNVVLDVDDSEVGYYTNLGYNLLDDKSNVVQKVKSTDIATLQKELDDAEKKISELTNEIALLRKVNEELKKPAEVEQPRPTRRGKKGVE